MLCTMREGSAASGALPTVTVDPDVNLVLGLMAGRSPRCLSRLRAGMAAPALADRGVRGVEMRAVVVAEVSVGGLVGAEDGCVDAASGGEGVPVGLGPAADEAVVGGEGGAFVVVAVPDGLGSGAAGVLDEDVEAGT